MTADGRTDRGPVVRDAAAVAGYLLLTAATGTTDGGRAPLVPIPAALLLTLATALPVVARRRWPVPVFAAVLAATCAGILVDTVRDPFLPAALALYTVAAEGIRTPWWRRWLPGLAILALGGCALLVPLHTGPGDWWSDGVGLLVLGCAALLGAWELGRAAYERRAFAVRTAHQLAQRAVADERLRIARELHDVVTHSIGLIVVRAGVANHVVRSRPEEAHEALRVIEATGRGALTELRHMLGVLRSPATGERVPAALAPVPGTAGLPALARRAGAALTTEGLDGLPAGMGVTVYRIVQEALTNVLRHAGPGTPCRITARATGDAVLLLIEDDGPPRPPAPDGHGIAGMRERAAVYGGVLTAAPRPGGGFTVRAELPYAADAPAPAPPGPTERKRGT
ncbi:histidine kinase [Streptomyces sp. NPDC020875]|uniref:sensor histidine kinase n=1 Tax=Streptomyces sp. NPDC020875 TaxID=3154898 RepID=UPI00340354B5